MNKIGSGMKVRLVPLLRALLAAGSIAMFSACPASAGQLEGVAEPIGETVGAPVAGVVDAAEGVTGSVTGPTQQVTEAAQSHTKEVIEAGEAAANATPGTVTRPTAGHLAAAADPSAKAAGSSAGGPLKGAAAVVGETTVTATSLGQEVEGAVEGVTESVPSPATVDPTRIEGVAPTKVEEDGGPSSTSTTSLGAGNPASGRDAFEASSSGGAVQAPVPKWVAYVWPAVALVAPRLADLLRHWGQEALGLVSNGGAGSGFGVAGVHASGGRPQAGDSSPSIFSKIPSALGGFPSEVPESALAYLLIATILVMAILAGVRHEISRDRKRPER